MYEHKQATFPTAIRCTSVAFTAALIATGAWADQVTNDDSIIVGNSCIGIDCVNGEAFGFDTIRMKENNLRIKALDTSSSAAFPKRDWQITFNDSVNGGLEKFSIDDIDGGKTPFTIEGNAPSHSLYVDDSGRIGIRTSTPATDIHVKKGDTPTLRLEQDGSSGWTPQTWDLAGNEANFFLRDVTNGSRLPFRVRPGAPTSSIDVKANGDVGLGTALPDGELHITRSDATPTFFVLENTNAAPQAVQIRLISTSSNNRRIIARNGMAGPAGNESQIVFGDDGAFTFAGASVGSGNVMTIDSSGNVVITGNCSDAAGGGGCTADYVFEPDYQLMPLEELAEFVAENRHLPNVPSADETRTNGLNLSAMNGRLLEKVEELTLYTLSQQETIDRLEARMSALESQSGN